MEKIHNNVAFCESCALLLQSPKGDISYMQKFFLMYVGGRMPLHLQEDFCGTALLRYIVIVPILFTCLLLINASLNLLIFHLEVCLSFLFLR